MSPHEMYAADGHVLLSDSSKVLATPDGKRLEQVEPTIAPTLALNDSDASPTIALRAQLPADILEALQKEPGFDADLIWTSEEDRKVLLKTDLMALVPAVFIFISLCLDRTNVANALTDNLLGDLHMNQDQLNTSTTLFFLGIFLFEIPFVMIAKRVGPHRFLPLTIMAWGAFTAGQAFVTNHRQLWGVRFCIGMFEAGFVPGFAYYLGRFYIRGDISARFAAFWAANPLAAIIGGVVSLGILELRGRAGLAGWRWLFIIEGLFTVLVGIFALLWFPASAADSRSVLVPHGWYSEREAAIMTTRVLVDDHRKAVELNKNRITRGDIVSTLCNWRVMLVVFGGFAALIQSAPVTVYMPLIVKRLGYKRYTANVLVIPGYVLNLVTSIGFGVAVNRLGGRYQGLFTALLASGSAVGSLWISLPPDDTKPIVLYFAGLLLIWCATSFVGIVASWVSNAVEPRQKPIALALLVMAYNLAGIPGSRVLRASDAPRYRKGFATIAGTSAAAAVVMVVAHFLLRKRAPSRTM